MYEKGRSPERAERTENVWSRIQGEWAMLERLVPQDRQIVACSLSAAEGGEARLYPLNPHTLLALLAPCLATCHRLHGPFGVCSHQAHKGTCPKSKHKKSTKRGLGLRLAAAKTAGRGEGSKRTPEVPASDRHTGQVQA